MAKKTKQAKRNKKLKTQSESVIGKQIDNVMTFLIWSVRAAIVFVLTILGAVVTIYALGPKVSITVDPLLNQKDIFSCPFQVQNDGLLSISNIWYYCCIREAKQNNGGKGLSGTLTRNEEVPVRILAPGEATTTFCTFPDETPSPIVYADIEIVVSFQPKWWFREEESRRRFETVRRSDGSIYWKPKALSEE